MQKTCGFRSRLSIIKNIFGIDIARKFEELHNLRRLADRQAHVINNYQVSEARKLSIELIRCFRSYLEKLGVI